MPKIHGGLSLVWNDAAAPVFASGSGSASPSYTVDLIAETSGGDNNELRIPAFTAGTNDRVYTVTQVLHDLYIPNSGTVTFRPHVHWTFIAEPTTGRTVVWELNYVYAKAGAVFPAAVTPLIATAYTTTGDAEIRTHIITELGNIVINAADLGPSMIFIWALKLKDTSTVDAGRVGLLSFDLHYLCGPRGTDSEYS